LNTSFASGVVQIGKLDEFGIVAVFLEKGFDHAVDVSLAPCAAGTESDYFNFIPFLSFLILYATQSSIYCGGLSRSKSIRILFWVYCSCKYLQYFSWLP